MQQVAQLALAVVQLEGPCGVDAAGESLHIARAGNPAAHDLVEARQALGVLHGGHKHIGQEAAAELLDHRLLPRLARAGAPARENTPLLDRPTRSATACSVIDSSPSAAARSSAAPTMAARVSSDFWVLASMGRNLAQLCEINQALLSAVLCAATARGGTGMGRALCLRYWARAAMLSAVNAPL